MDHAQLISSEFNWFFQLKCPLKTKWPCPLKNGIPGLTYKHELLKLTWAIFVCFRFQNAHVEVHFPCRLKDDFSKPN